MLKDLFVIILVLFCIAISITVLILLRKNLIEDSQAISSGNIIAVLSVLVTILIGWNIYQLIDFNEKERRLGEELDAIRQENRKDIDAAVEETKTTLRRENSCDLAINGSMYFIERKHYQQALFSLVSGMTSAVQLKNKEYVNSIAMNIRYVIIEAQQNGTTLFLRKESKDILMKGIANYFDGFYDSNVNSNVTSNDMYGLINSIHIE